MRYFNRDVFLTHPNGDRSDYIPVCGEKSFSFTVPEREIPVTHSIRLVGETDYFWKWRCESGSPYSISAQIDDALDKSDTFQEAFSLHFKCNHEPYDREAWIKLTRAVLKPGQKCTFSFPGKANGLEFAPGGRAAVELEIYLAKDGRHPDDVFDAPDLVRTLELPSGTFDWQQLQEEFVLPADAACVMVHIIITGAKGEFRIGSPRLCFEGCDNIIPPFERQQFRNREFVYTAAHISRREWIEFECLVDDKKIFDGELYTSIFRRPDFDLPCGVLTPGEHTLKFKFKNDYESAIGFIVQQLELLEYGNHDFEIVAAPEHIKAGDDIRVLVKTSVPNVEISGPGCRKCFAEPGLHGFVIPAPEKSGPFSAVLSSSGFSDTVNTVCVPWDDEAAELYLSTGDSVFVRNNPEDMLRFLEWYLENNIGNAVCFRHSYRWGGGRFMNETIWKQAVALLRELRISYSLMVDGREAPGRKVNPPEHLLDGEGYLGRQAHENDGAFYYWNNVLWKPEELPVPLADVISRSGDKGGIHPRVRPKRRDSRAWWFFDPTDADDVRSASEAFVNNLRDARSESCRHSGPSVLFRYFFQAGYKFLLAEQMYGPEEVILSALRGASRAYGANGFGAHLATQWGSGPHDTPEHAERYFLSLAACYIQGATQMNIEEGLYRMESGFVDYDRFSRNCLRHQEAHHKFRRFMDTHPRCGKLVTPIACIQGRYDGWCCFTRPATVWNREGEQWKFGAPEESFDLLNVFFPRSRMTDIYNKDCPKAPQGWYTGTPYGPVDLLPFEGDWSSYKAIIFLGWHTWEPGDDAKMLEFVNNGGVLLLSRRHLSGALRRDVPAVYKDTPALQNLLGKDWQQASGLIRRQSGAGKVIFFASDSFPSEAEIRNEYISAMREIGEITAASEAEKLWVKGSDDVNFGVYEKADGSRTAYMLNIRWWDSAESEAVVLRNGKEEKLILAEGDITVR